MTGSSKMERKTRPWLGVLVSSILLFAILVAFFSSLPFKSSVKSYSHGEKRPFTAPKQNIWAELSEDEATDVYEYLLEEFAYLNLTKHPKNSQDNFVHIIESLKPNKTDAISYIYGDAPKVDRYAKVSLGLLDAEHGPILAYYQVGPLPISSDSKAVPLEYPFNAGRNFVKNPIYDYVGIIDFGLAIAENVSDITEALLGASANRENPNDPHGLLAFPRVSRVESGGLVLWMQFYRPGMGSGARTLLPQGIYVKIDATSPKISEWKVGEYYYNGGLYENEQAFRAALDDPDFEKAQPNLDGPWTDTEDFDSAPPGRELPPPVSVQPYGPRYKLDRKERYVSWFGFEFYLTTAQATGVGIFDIRFKGERIMYELNLQEAMAHYAGDDPMQGGQEFLDTFFGMGKNAFELVPGYDCPAYADYLDSDWHAVFETQHVPNSICIFEFTSDHLMSRHTSQYSVTVSRNTFLTVRSVSTVGNYDYAIDYIFYLDGTIEVKVRASGFIFGAFYSASSKDEYGHRIHDALSSSMHDHVIGFKADLDVAGSSNDLVRMAVEPLTKSYPWDLPEAKQRNTMHIVEYPVTEETGLDWPKNGGEFYIVYSDKKNAWGERKGYRIISGTGIASTPHLTILNSTTLGNSARWAEHDLWVIKQKDHEPRSADPLNYLDPYNPIIDFTKLADHEGLEEGEDLVIYFNVGSHHVPHSGDIPNTLMHTSASSVMFIPHNFADRDPSRASVQGVRLQLKGKDSGGFAGELHEPSDLRSRMDKRGIKEKQTKANYFGARYEEGMKLSLEDFEPDLRNYHTSAHMVTDLTMNDTAAGKWVREGA